MLPLLGHNLDYISALSHTATGFALYFSCEIERVIIDSVLSVSFSTQWAFHCHQSSTVQTENWEIRRYVSNRVRRRRYVRSLCHLRSSPVLWTFILWEFIHVLLPFVTPTINASLLQAQLFNSQKHAIATPLLKKSRPKCKWKYILTCKTSWMNLMHREKMT